MVSDYILGKIKAALESPTRSGDEAHQGNYRETLRQRVTAASGTQPTNGIPPAIETIPAKESHQKIHTESQREAAEQWTYTNNAEMVSFPLS